MENLYKHDDAKHCIDRYRSHPRELALCVYASRLIGKNPCLVLHGGGNASVKIKTTAVTGEDRDVLFVKGSGKDMAGIEPTGFSGLNLDPIRKLCTLDRLSEAELTDQLKIHRISSQEPDPSVESLLHANLPHRYIYHTHADDILILGGQKNALALIKEVLGDRAAVIDYVGSGLSLAQAVREQYEKIPDMEAVVVIHHGIFTFSHDSETAYGNMIRYVGRAGAWIEKQIGKTSRIDACSNVLRSPVSKAEAADVNQILRGLCAHQDSTGTLRRFVVELRCSSELTDASYSERATDLCRTGVLTPDHVIRTKNNVVYIDSIPKDNDALKSELTGKIDEFKAHYRHYFDLQAKGKKSAPKPLDPFPRLFLIRGLGLAALGITRKDARIAADIGEQTISAKLRAFALGDWVPISNHHVFDMEYWTLQQKKISSSVAPLLQGQVALITGGGGAVGYGIAQKLLESGAVVVLADIDDRRLHTVYSALIREYDKDQVETICFDVGDFTAVKEAVADIGRRLGGLDILVPNAGIAHVSTLEDLDPAVLDKVIDVNLKGTFNVIKATVPVFKMQGTGGNIVVISSKNVFDPGASFGAYSASKAGVHQMAKIAAMELAGIGVRVNMINPDAVFGDEDVSSGLWDLIGPDRMKSRGLNANGLKDYYKNRNLLKTSVLAEHVGNGVVFFASNQTPTTGATLPVDGGIPGAFPR